MARRINMKGNRKVKYVSLDDGLSMDVEIMARERHITQCMLIKQAIAAYINEDRIAKRDSVKE